MFHSRCIKVTSLMLISLDFLVLFPCVTHICIILWFQIFQNLVCATIEPLICQFLAFSFNMLFLSSEYVIVSCTMLHHGRLEAYYDQVPAHHLADKPV